MKMRLIILALVSWASLTAQSEKGVTPLTTSPPLEGAGQRPENSGGRLHAVVIGISDYQDAGIPDLKYAHRDAEAFANFLRSPAGGGLDADHLKVLLNEDATAGRVAEALDGLIEQAKEGDQIIIYFSGHGDVEGKKISQPGFLLCWDAPSRVYMGGGTYSLAYLQEVVSTLSVQTKAKVTVITDACHAGKLAGSQIGGSQLTAANLAKQYANEVKMLSCQPGEFSLEGEQWGGGRGAFSYHLVEALYGFADRNGDGQVTLGELDRYLEDHVTAEAAPQSQVPMLLGNKTEQLATVNAQVLAELTKNKSGQVTWFASTESRGLEEEVLAGVDSTVRQMYLAFKKAVKDKRFFEPEGDCAEHYYAQLSQNERLAPLHGVMRRNYAAALQDDAQQALNRFMAGDEKELGLSYSEQLARNSRFPRQLGRSAELLGEGHYLYRELRARESYFEGFKFTFIQFDAETGVKSVANLRKALEWQPGMPLALYGLARAYAYQTYNSDSMETYVNKAAAAAPAWVVPYASLAKWFSIDYVFDKAAHYLQLAEQMDSNHLLVVEAKGLYYLYQKKYREAEELLLGYLSKSAYPDGPGSNWKVLFILAKVYMETGREAQAEPIWRQLVAFDPSNGFNSYELGKCLLVAGRLAEAERMFYEAGKADYPHNPDIGYNQYMIYFYAYQNKMDEAFDALEKCLRAGYDGYDWIQVDPDYEKLRAHPELWKALMKQYFPEKVKD